MRLTYKTIRESEYDITESTCWALDYLLPFNAEDYVEWAEIDYDSLDAGDVLAIHVAQCELLPGDWIIVDHMEGGA